jgi:hypothetical protein
VCDTVLPASRLRVLLFYGRLLHVACRMLLQVCRLAVFLSL